MASDTRNTLYYGDNLEILREYIADESIDLIYLDPPFNSNADYNVLFAEHDQTKAAAQIQAFEDTWKWDAAAAEAFHEAITSPAGRVPEAMQAFKTFLGESDMLAYLSMMAPRLVELHCVLKPTGSIYLHCDPTASHYLKMLMDAVFGPVNFRNEIIWKRTSAHSSAKRFGPVHDVILFYGKGDRMAWHGSVVEHDPEYVRKFFRQTEPETNRKFHANVLTGAGIRHGDSGKPWRGYNPTEHNRHWAIPGKMIQQIGTVGLSLHEKLDALDDAGRIYWPAKSGGSPRIKYYADELGEGHPTPDVWSDIGPISGKAAEKLGYPTQKPEALLERIISASSNEGDTVLDPFCGCGTAIAVAEKLHRRWVGIDITHLAVNLIKTRLRDAFNIKPPEDYDVVGEPTSLSGAKQLAEEDRFQFQAWALGLVGARVASSSKKGADKGIDGKLYFDDNPDPKKPEIKQVIFSVKSGKTSVRDVRDLRGVLDREAKSGAQIGVLITLQEPSAPMRQEAASAGVYDSPWGTSHARLQIITIEELLDGRTIGMPRSTDIRAATFKKAPRAKKKSGKPQGNIPGFEDIETPF